MTVVVLPNGDEVEFPDGMSERDMQDVIALNFPQGDRKQRPPSTPGILGFDPGTAPAAGLLGGGPSFEDLSRVPAPVLSPAAGGAPQRRGGLRSEARPYVADEGGNPALKAKPREDAVLDRAAGMKGDGLTDGSFDWDAMSDQGRTGWLRRSQAALAKMGIYPIDQGASLSVAPAEALADKWSREARDALSRSGISAPWSAINQAAGDAASLAGDAAMTANKGVAMGAGLAFKAADMLTLGAAVTDDRDESLFSRSARLADAIGDAATANQSAETRRQIQDLGSANGFWDAAGKLARNPRALLDMAASSGGGSMAVARIAARGGGRLAVGIAAGRGIQDAETLAKIYAAGSEWGSGMGNVLMNAGDTFNDTDAGLTGKLQAAVIAAAGTKVADKMFNGGAEAALARGMQGYKEAAKTFAREPGQEMVESFSQSAGKAAGEGTALDLDKAAGQALIEAAAAAPMSGAGALRMAYESSRLPPEPSAEAMARANGFLGGPAGPPDTPGAGREPAPVARRVTPPVMPQYAVFTSEATESAGLAPVTIALPPQAAPGEIQLDPAAAASADQAVELPTPAPAPEGGQPLALAPLEELPSTPAAGPAAGNQDGAAAPAPPQAGPSASAPITVASATFHAPSGPVGVDNEPVPLYPLPPSGGAAPGASAPVRLTSNREAAERAAHAHGDTQSPTPQVAAVSRPYLATAEQWNGLRDASPRRIAEVTRNLQAQGHDGIAFAHPDGSLELMAFDPAQVRQAARSDKSPSPSSQTIDSQGQPDPAPAPFATLMGLVRRVGAMALPVSIWRDHVNRWAGLGPVQAREVRESGLLKRLAALKGRVTRAFVLSHVNDASVRASRRSPRSAGQGSKGAGPGSHADRRSSLVDAQAHRQWMRGQIPRHSKIHVGEPRPEDDARIAGIQQAITALLGDGHPVVAYADYGAEALNGFAHEGVAMINTARNEQGVAFTVLHEIKHVIEQIAEADTDAGLSGTPAQKFVARIDSLFDDMSEAGKRAYLEEYLIPEKLEGKRGKEREHIIQTWLNGDTLRSEMPADFMGLRAEDPAFMRWLAKADPKGFESFVKKWLAILGDMIARLRGEPSRHGFGPREVDSYVRNLEHAKEVALHALIEYRGEMAAGNSPVRTRGYLAAQARKASQTASPSEGATGGAPPRRGLESELPADSGEPIGDKLARRIDEDYAGAVRAYEAISGTMGGKLLDVDLARELSPEYRADRSRSQEVQAAAAAFVQRMFTERMAAAGKGMVVLMSGGAGAGKSSAQSLLGGTFALAHTILDGTLSRLPAAVAHIEEATSHGHNVVVVHVSRDPVKAFVDGVIPRARETGRTVPITYVARSHAAANAVMQDLTRIYAGDHRVRILAVDNDGAQGEARLVDPATITSVIIDGLEERLRDEAGKARDRNTLDEGLHRAFVEAGGDARDAGGLPEGHGGIHRGAESGLREGREPVGPKDALSAKGGEPRDSRRPGPKPDSEDPSRGSRRLYTLGVKRGKRIVDQSIELSEAQVAAIEGACLKEGLSADQIEAVKVQARRQLRRSPRIGGWAAHEFDGLCVQRSPDGTIATDQKGRLLLKVHWKRRAYGFNLAPGRTRAPAGIDQAHLGNMVRALVAQVVELHERADQGDELATRILDQRHWFRNVTEILWRDFGAQAYPLADLLGAMSPQTSAATNLHQALEIWQRFSAGEFDEQMRAFTDHLHAGGRPADFDKSGLIRQASGKSYGVNTLHAMVALANHWHGVSPGRGPKGPNFTGNLTGELVMATIDRWVGRHLRRVANERLGMDLPRIPVEVEQRITGRWSSDASRVTGEFGFGAELLRLASLELTERRGYELLPPDLQSIIWFTEKAHWAELGLAPEPGEHDSFDAQLDDSPVQRFTMGMAGSQGDAMLSEDSALRNVASLQEKLQQDPTVMSTHGSPMIGALTGQSGPALEVEWVARHQKFNATRILGEGARLCKESGQERFFISRVLRPGETSSNARPGAEVYFKRGTPMAEVQAVMAAFKARDLEGFTLVMDPRAKGLSPSGEHVIGLKVQYIPEFDKSVTPSNVETFVDIRGMQLSDIVRKLRGNEAVASAAVYSYDTEVVFKEDFDAHIDRAAAVGDQATGGPAWPERSLRARLEEAASRVSRAPGRADGGPLLHGHADGAGFGDQAQARIGPAPARRGPVDLPDAIIANPLGAAAAHSDYAAAKAGDRHAALRVAESLVTPELVHQIRLLKPDAIVGVMAQEASGRNKIPLMAAAILAQKTGAKLVVHIVQSNSPRRTTMDGVSRLFAPPRFEGLVDPGISYVILDDTVTQGSTLAGLGEHIQNGGGRVVGAVALTGQQRSAKLSLSQEILHAVRAKFSEFEQGFRRIARYGFDRLTNSEGQYLASLRRIDAFRDRILAGGSQAGRGVGDEDAAGAQGRLSGAGFDDPRQPAGRPAAPTMASAGMREVAQGELNAWAKRQGLASDQVPDVRTPDREAEATVEAVDAAIGGLLGSDHRVIAYSDARRTAANGFALSGTAFVNVGSNQQGVAHTALHEITHVAEQAADADTAAGLNDTPAQRFVAALHKLFDAMSDAGKRAYLKNYLLKAKLGRLPKSLHAETIEAAMASPELRSEMVADFMGNRGSDPLFWAHAAQLDPQGFGGFVKRWLAILDGMLERLRGASEIGDTESRKVDGYVRNLQQARELAAQALVAYRRDLADQAEQALAGADARGSAGPTASTGKDLAGGSPEPKFSAAGEPSMGDQLQRRIDANFDGVVREYEALPGTDGGRLLDVDLARELSPQYRADRSRASEVHGAAGEFIHRLLDRRLSEPGAGSFVFMAGGSGAGKSSAQQLLGPVLDGADTILDGTLSDPGRAADRVRRALEAGRRVQVVYVYRDPVRAFVDGVIPRAMQTGRPVPIEAVARTHAGALATVRELQRQFGPDARFEILAIDNSGAQGSARLVSLQSITTANIEGLEAQLHEEVEKALRAGALSEKLYDAMVAPRAQQGRRGHEASEATTEATGGAEEAPGATPRLDGAVAGSRRDAGDGRQIDQGRRGPQPQDPGVLQGRRGPLGSGHALDADEGPPAEPADRLEIELDRPATDEEQHDFERAVRRWIDAQGKTGWRDAFAFVLSPRNISIVNKMVLSHDELRGAVVDMARRWLPGFRWRISMDGRSDSDDREAVGGMDHSERRASEASTPEALQADAEPAEADDAAQGGLLLLGHTPTTHTLAEIRRMPREERWRAAEQYFQELFGSAGQEHFVVPAGLFEDFEIFGPGGRNVDAPVHKADGTIIANEVKAYQRWTTVNGATVQNSVPLSKEIREQVNKDVRLRAERPGYTPRWIFLDTPPSPELDAYLSKYFIDYVVYH